ncbi:centrosomal protein of 63 kDa isoform X6 [Synchiropus splendidus]|uniref:centrosomal protein of 63 kDa isoform X6 n=1 Tax=Synchiropus splendidus TaxID=270530 RepID=UPI00237DB619|nr:centrosomal protein of 63 kDa isoform X6 [Synchiropus splendidus]
MGTPFDDLRNSDLGSILTSCEPELQELMRQVDIMMEEQRKEWQGEKLVLEARLRSMEEELRASRELNQRMDVEIKLLRRQTEEASGRLDLVEKYKQQLHDVSAELEELKRSYQKLQQKQAKYAAKGAQAREISQLHQKIEEYQQLCTRYNKQQKTLETQNKSLVEELERVNLQFETYQKETEQKYLERCPELQCLEAQLESAREHLHVQELELERLRCLEALSLGQEGAEGAGDYRCAAKPESSEELRRLRQENSNLLTQLQAKDEVIRTLEINVKANGKISLSNVRKELENAKATILSAQACERDMKAEAKRLRDKLDQMRLQIGEHAKTETQMTEVNQATEQQLALIRMVLQLDMAPGSNSKSSPEGAVGGMISTSLQRSVSPANSTVARYLEQESIHERELMQRIDSYIQAFKDGTTDIAGEHRPEEPGRG